jgi:hypothetical protein
LAIARQAVVFLKNHLKVGFGNTSAIVNDIDLYLLVRAMECYYPDFAAGWRLFDGII